ncbi:MAG: amidophosphoribosyltransferase [Thermoflexus sp.]|uniref:amidophosphoribosyltransferase n=1 Tax=Thermoflexus sp. TaxID=1969742 RepID=UPI0033175C26
MAGDRREACGVVGIVAPGQDAARLALLGLYALQHRGQESAGIATSDGQAAYLHKGMGLVSQVFEESLIRQLRGPLAIGHTRYATTGSSTLRNAQPFLIETLHGPLGLAHNGQLVHASTLRRRLLARGVGLASGSDSELILQILASPPEAWAEEIGTVPPDPDPWVERIRALLRLAPGAYALVLLTREALYAVRDPYGFRPLCLGALDPGYAVASESGALRLIGARYLREIRPGEIVRLDAHGLRCWEESAAPTPAFCVFEYIYFMRPDARREGGTIYGVRLALGRQLAREAPAPADIVVGVPDSATPHAIGYSLESGLPFIEGLIKNRYIGRTFIQPDDAVRRMGVRLKFEPLVEVLRGRRVVLVDDSIVRGHTTAQLVQLLREGGAAEVHVRVASPPIRHPCFMGIDMATYEELIAHRLDVERIRHSIGADSLAYLSLPGLIQAVRAALPGGEGGYCTACFTGRYPIPVEEEATEAVGMVRRHPENIQGVSLR